LKITLFLLSFPSPLLFARLPGPFRKSKEIILLKINLKKKNFVLPQKGGGS
jgi:hypothetical protein